jgi:hypothetical protein
LLVALLLAGALLAALPALAGGLPSLVRDRVDGPIAVLEPGTATPSNDDPQPPPGTGAAPDPGAEAAGDAGRPSAGNPGAGAGRRFDRGDNDRDDDSSGPGRSGGDSGVNGSSGPG